MLYQKKIDSPVGELTLVASDKGLRFLGFGQNNKYPALDDDIQDAPAHPVLVKAEKQLAEYFAGKRNSFDLPLELKGSVFQQKAWRALQTIPYGSTCSYGEQATRLGDKNKARAVGLANNRNPLSIIIPCHRVVGANGSLTGYAGGLNRKEWLLKLESIDGKVNGNIPSVRPAAATVEIASDLTIHR